MLFRFIAKKDEETVSLLFSAILLLFKSYRSYELFLDLSQTQQTALLSCMTMKRRHVDEQALTLILISILRTHDVQWFLQQAFTDSVLANYKTVRSTTQILISFSGAGVSRRSHATTVPGDVLLWLLLRGIQLLHGGREQYLRAEPPVGEVVRRLHPLHAPDEGLQAPS